MAIKLITNDSKRLGLPGYSSHQYSVSVETELVATADIPAESARLYELLQADVDHQMQQTGFVPPLDYGMAPGAPANGSHGTNGANGANDTNDTPLDGRWKCSIKQRDLILKLVDEHQLDKHRVESLAVERFGHGVRLLNKLEASGLIDELLGTHGNGGNPWQADPAPDLRNGSGHHGADGSNGRRSAA